MNKRKKARAYEGFELILHGIQMTAKMYRYVFIFIFAAWFFTTLYFYFRRFPIEFNIILIKYIAAETCMLLSKFVSYLKSKSDLFAMLPDPSNWHFKITYKNTTLIPTAYSFTAWFRAKQLPLLAHFWLKSILVLIAAETICPIVLSFLFKLKALKKK